MLSSNRLHCNAPDLPLANGLGMGAFVGITYPANAVLSVQLLERAKVPPFIDRLKALIPSVQNVVLLFTGQL